MRDALLLSGYMYEGVEWYGRRKMNARVFGIPTDKWRDR